MTDKQPAFFAYPSDPADVPRAVRSAVNLFNVASPSYLLEGWERNDISGLPITDPIFDKINSCAFLAADVTFLNENVAFEIGYAIGRGRRVLLFANQALPGDRDLANSVGIFDTLGYQGYDSSEALANLLLSRTDFTAISINPIINRQQPVFIVEPSQKDNYHIMIVSRTKKARWKYRSFNPDEDVRLSASDAIRHVTQSAGVIAPLQDATIAHSREHNLRSMFVAGLSSALEIPTLIIHPSYVAPPLDVRDITARFHRPSDIAEIVQRFSLEITDFGQQTAPSPNVIRTLLSKLTVGDPTAENEMTSLASYYVDTDEFQRALRGDVNVVVGRKGSGKTALFIRLRDVKRSNKQNIVVDLKPEDFQLVKLKERVMTYLSVGGQQHLITAFWEYILLLEIAYKVLEKDRQVHIRDHNLTAVYQELRQLYIADEALADEGDFRERLSRLSESVIIEFFEVFRDLESRNQTPINITTGQVTEILYRLDIARLRDVLARYLRHKDEVWLLFDNIDKGWSTDGVSVEDVLILRCLINASRKIEREFRRPDLVVRSIVFVRDDVYSLLMGGSADYGKEMRASVDWSDADLLGQILTRRLSISLSRLGESDAAIDGICVSHHDGEPWLRFMCGRSLMRPRHLLKLFRHCLAYAINMGHSRIENEDIERGLRAYAQDLVIEVDRELSDVLPIARKLIYQFSEERPEFFHEDLVTLIELSGMDRGRAQEAIDFLLYYGVLGVRKPGDDAIYIYDVNYDAEMLKVRIQKWGQNHRFVLNPALWPALMTLPPGDA